MPERTPGPSAELANGLQVRLEAPGQADVLALIAALDAYQDSLYPPESRYALDLSAAPPGRVLLAVARHPAGRAVGCGAVVLGVVSAADNLAGENRAGTQGQAPSAPGEPLGSRTADASGATHAADAPSAGCAVAAVAAGELKRMYVLPDCRGHGVAAAVLKLLEAEAWAAGCRQLLLETGPRQPEALAFYARCGYQRRGPFGSYPDDPLSVFMGKQLLDGPPPQQASAR